MKVLKIGKEDDLEDPSNPSIFQMEELLCYHNYYQ
jgi:hypothetical protein